jgi:hypothetical protein
MIARKRAVMIPGFELKRPSPSPRTLCLITPPHLFAGLAAAIAEH